MEQEKPTAKRYTVAEYMALAERSEVRHEFFEGEVFAMSGGSIRHNRLIGNCVFALRTGLRGRKCGIFFESVQLAVEKGRYYSYPDVAVTCSSVDLEAERTIEAPVLLIEVLSKSTEIRDRSWKFDRYKALPSLRHYLLISQKTCLVEWYRREESGVWSFTPLSQFTNEIYLPGLEMTVLVQDIYEDTGVVQMTIYPGPEAESELD